MCGGHLRFWIKNKNQALSLAYYSKLNCLHFDQNMEQACEKVAFAFLCCHGSWVYHAQHYWNLQGQTLCTLDGLLDTAVNESLEAWRFCSMSACLSLPV